MQTSSPASRRCARGLLPLLLAALALATSSAEAAGFLDRLLGGKKTNATDIISALPGAALSAEQMGAGLKEALANGVRTAVTNLGRADGYLTNVAVRIPMPENLRRVEQGLRKMGQGALADEFTTTMNRAAEAAVPEAAAIFADAIRQMTVADARALLDGPEDAATQYFRKTGGARLEERMLPIVRAATEKAGVTGAYKRLSAQAGPLTTFVRLPGISDVDAYVTQKAGDGLFKMIAEEERRIRQNPAARTTELLQKVFSGARPAVR